MSNINDYVVFMRGNMEDLPSDPSLMDDNTVYFALDQGVIFFLKADNTAAYFYSRSFDNDLFVPGTGTDSVCMKISDPQFVNFANGLRSMAIGTSNKSDGEGSFSCGKFNASDSSIVFSVGVGIDNLNRKNGLSVKDNGDVYYKEDLVEDIHDDLLAKAIAIASAGSGMIKFVNAEGKPKAHQVSSSVKVNTKSPVDVYYVDSEGIDNLTGLFKDCSLMTNCNLENSVIEAITMDNMFENCKSLNDSTLKGLECSNAVSMSEMFKGCTGLTNDRFLNGVVGNSVNDISGLFKGCTGITGAADPCLSFDFSGIDNASEMYMGCTGLDSVTLYGSAVTLSDANMKNMFKDCSMIYDVGVENGFFSNKTNVSNMFNGCGNLEFHSRSGNVDFTADSSIDASGMFRYCENVNALSIFNFQNNCDINHMFSGCGNVDIVALDTASGCNASGLFSDCSNVVISSYMRFSGNNTNFSDGCSGSGSVKFYDIVSTGSINCANAFANCGVIEAPMSDETPLLTFNDNANLTNLFMDSKIGDNGIVCLFKPNKTVNCTGMFKNAEIPNMSFLQYWSNLDSINNAASMFENCTGVDALPSNFTIGTTNATNMFKNTTLAGDASKNVILKTLFSKIGNGVTTTGTFNDTGIIGAIFTGGVSCTNPKEMFKDCSELQYVEADSDTVLKGDMSYMFANCSNLLSIKGLKDADISSAGDMAYMFDSCQDISILALPAIAKQESIDYQGMFKGCSMLTSVTFGNESGFDNKQPDNMSQMFAGCGLLQSIHNMPPIILQRDNCAEMFKECGKLTYLTFDSGSKFTITALDDVGVLDFSSSKMLTNGTIDVILNALVNNGKEGKIMFSNECVTAYDAAHTTPLAGAITAKGWKLLMP